MNLVIRQFNDNEVNLKDFINHQPRLFEVVLHNDDFTPMKFVIEMLENFFGLDSNKAKKITLKAHTKGRAVCGRYSKEIAESRISQAIDYARKREYPLKWTMEGP
ncbi:MAG TPA: ATP-dependent Clp protease adaptor ClpS [Gammaproteobacteria bacterium]|nr:ATP-dependent Clp protease adaptor ClpS [Gammaproteobacteria bacterium]